jgi:arginase family enzyme
MGATAYTLYFLTHENQWVSSLEGFTNEKVTAMGFDPETLDESYSVEGVKKYKKSMVATDPEKVADEFLSNLSEEARVLIHLDLDVISESELTSVYMPSPNGLSMDTITRLLKPICHDKRIAGVVITEFSPKASSSIDVGKIIEMLSQVLIS